MMNTYKEFILGPEAIEYVQKSLGMGKTLAHFIMVKSSSWRGKVFTFFPKDFLIKDNDINEFMWGKLPQPSPTHKITRKNGKKLIYVPLPSTQEYLITLIQKYLNEKEGRMCIFEDPYGKPSDLFFSSKEFLSMNISTLIFGNDIYYSLTKKDSDREHVTKVFNQGFAFSPPTIAIITSVSGKNWLPVKKQSEITLEQLKMLTDRAEKIIIGAYDGEGYLIWEKV